MDCTAAFFGSRLVNGFYFRKLSDFIETTKHAATEAQHLRLHRGTPREGYASEQLRMPIVRTHLTLSMVADGTEETVNCWLG